MARVGTADATRGCGAWGPTSPPFGGARGGDMSADLTRLKIREGISHVPPVQSCHGLRPQYVLVMWRCSPTTLLRNLRQGLWRDPPVITHLPEVMYCHLAAVGVAGVEAGPCLPSESRKAQSWGCLRSFRRIRIISDFSGQHSA